MVQLKVSHCVADLDAFTQGVRERLERNLAFVRESKEPLTAVEEARFEVGFGLLTDMLKDLEGMLEQWRKGGAAYRTSEDELKHALRDEVAALVASLGVTHTTMLRQEWSPGRMAPVEVLTPFQTDASLVRKALLERGYQVSDLVVDTDASGGWVVGVSQ